jgi:hypothetical protein
MLPDTVHLDTVHLDTALLDTALLDTVHLDTALLDTALLDTALLDTALLDTALLDAADDAKRRVIVPSYGVVEGAARGRRGARAATAGVFGLVLCLAIGVAAVAGSGRGRAPDDAHPAAPAAALDPALRQYWTKIPILTWTPDAGHAVSTVESAAGFRTAVFSALGAGDHDFSNLRDLRTVFPAAPVGGPAVSVDQSVTKTQLERAAANLRKLDGVRDARVVEVSGLWFTVSATGPATAPALVPRSKPKRVGPPVVVTGAEPKPVRPPVINPEGLPIKGSASGLDRAAGNHWVNWVRATYVGPALDRATFDRLRARAAEAVHIDVSKVVVTAESAAGPEPTKS